MKMKIEVDCTPQEARTFLGLPDVEPLNRVMMEKVEEQIAKGAAFMDPESIAKTWFPIGSQGMEAMQKFMTAAMQTRAREPDGRTRDARSKAPDSEKL